MKTRSAVFGSIVLAAFAVGGFAPAHAGTVSFNFDGFCDGMTVKITNKTFVVGTSTGCLAGYVDEGFKGKNTHLATPPVLVISSNNNGVNPLTYVVDLTDGVWANYTTTDGVTQTQINSGTISIVTPQAAAAAAPNGSPPSTAPAK